LDCTGDHSSALLNTEHTVAALYEQATMPTRTGSKLKNISVVNAVSRQNIGDIRHLRGIILVLIEEIVKIANLRELRTV
jgi:hypothetical protein